ncbi:MAG: AtpZ/AtpI family protein [Rhodospirillaceae bacterium]|nr:AtpZ/AtpI family protein [Rhodospirillaceae bacterium]MBT4486562.1 AtpZ/AtpI family protein [Rhodospirillaceae bacterium]MBT7756593.1 AtpZ/AtpI family protein [Rhodospirillaceae bacterium]
MGELGGRISKARHDAGLEKTDAERDADAAVGAGLGAAWRISIEIVVALVVCTAIGWALDYWFGTKPWLMLIFLFLGGAAGMNNAVRTALRIDAQATEALQRKSQGDAPAKLGEERAVESAEDSTEDGEGDRRER